MTTNGRAFLSGAAASGAVAVACAIVNRARPFREYDMLTFIFVGVAAVSLIGSAVAPSMSRASLFVLGVMAGIAVATIVVMGPGATFGLIVLVPLMVPAALAGGIFGQLFRMLRM